MQTSCLTDSEYFRSKSSRSPVTDDSGFSCFAVFDMLLISLSCFFFVTGTGGMFANKIFTIIGFQPEETEQIQTKIMDANGITIIYTEYFDE